GVFESGVEDIDRLICARHSAILLLVVVRLPLVAEPGGRCDGRNRGCCERRSLSGHCSPGNGRRPVHAESAFLLPSEASAQPRRLKLMRVGAARPQLEEAKCKET